MIDTAGSTGGGIMRVLGACRLSHDTDESTSIERQREQIELTCRARGDVLVEITEDTDVSGAVSPFDRGGLGPWFAEPLVSKWDVLMVAKLDRLTRSLRDFDDLRVWCDSHGKSIVSVSESIDLSTSHGRMFANLLAMFAQFERERMSERRADAARKARLEGRYDGRTVPFGYAVEDGRYVKDPVYADVAAEMAADRLSGRSFSWISRKLNDRGIPPRGGAPLWRADKVQKILQNPSLNGIITKTNVEKQANGKGRHNGEFIILRGQDGRPLRFTDDPILNDEDWGRLQAVMKVKPQGQRAGGFLLTRVAFCECRQPLYGNRRPGGRQSYYRCATGATDHAVWCGARTIPSAELEADVEAKLLSRWGNRELQRRTVKAAQDHRADLEAITRQIDDVEREFQAGNWPAASAARMLANLEAEKENLGALPVVPAREDWEPAGVTLAEYWEMLSPDERGHLLRTMGVRIVAQRDGAGQLHVLTSLGTPEGFEHATGLVLNHAPEDHEPWYEIAGAFFARGDDGTLTEVRTYEPGQAETIGMVKDYLRIQADA
jgi:DNA invertase Pin-like site-specific DNA recombinase